MPVRRFRNLEEMEDSLWRDVDDPALMQAIASTWAFARRTCPLHFPPGVHRHRSIEEAQQSREAWEDASHREREERRQGT